MQSTTRPFLTPGACPLSSRILHKARGHTVKPWYDPKHASRFFVSTVSWNRCSSQVCACLRLRHRARFSLAQDGGRGRATCCHFNLHASTNFQHPCFKPVCCDGKNNRQHELWEAKLELHSINKTLHPAEYKAKQREVRAKRKEVCSIRLMNRIEQRSPKRHVPLQPVSLVVDGNHSTDRRQWAGNLEAYLGEKYSDPLNTKEQQQLRTATLLQHQDLEACPNNENRNRQNDAGIDWFHLLHAIASSRAGKANGPDDHSPDMFRSLPCFLRMKLMQALHHARTNPEDVTVPDVWRKIVLFGFPKPMGGDGWGGWRFISKTSHVQKALLRTLCAHEHDGLRESSVCSLGFRPGMSCHMMVWPVLESLRLSSTWQCVGTHIAILDIEKAFDYMNHSAIPQLLLKRGWTSRGVGTLMTHMCGMTAQPEIDGLPAMGSVDYHFGGRQGGAETAIVFADMIDAATEDVVESWNDKGYGFRVDGKMLLNHVVWADNFVLLADSGRQLRDMINELTLPLQRWGFRWKTTSLEYIRVEAKHHGKLSSQTSSETRWNTISQEVWPSAAAAKPRRGAAPQQLLQEPVRPAPAQGVARLQDQPDLTEKAGDNELFFRRVRKAELLGTLLDERGSTRQCIEANQAKVEKKYWSIRWVQARNGKVQTSMTKLLEVYLSELQPVLLWNCETWHISRSALDSPRQWEERFLARFLWTHRVTAYHDADGRHRTAKQCVQWTWRNLREDGKHDRTADMVWLERNWAFLNQIFSKNRYATSVLRPLLCTRSRSQWPTVQAGMKHRYSHEGGWRSIQGAHTLFWDDWWCQTLGEAYKEECHHRDCRPVDLLGPHTKAVFLTWIRRGPRVPDGALLSWQSTKRKPEVTAMTQKHNHGGAQQRRVPGYLNFSFDSCPSESMRRLGHLLAKALWPRQDAATPKTLVNCPRT